MTLAQAEKKAARLSRRAQDWRFVLCDPSHEDGTGQPFHVASDDDLETFFAGVREDRIVVAFGPDGQPE